MKALIAHDFGVEAAKVENAPDPHAAGDELVVEIAAAALNPLDNKILAGQMKELFPITFPYIPGSDFAGKVVEIGPEVEGYALGDRVGGVAPKGALAERMTISSKSPMIARIPSELDDATAAAVPVVGLTAQAVIDAAKIRTGQTVVVLGAPGGVGAFVTQMAAAQGARVVATATPEQHRFMQSLGATVTFDYHAMQLPVAMAKCAPDGVDVLVDLVNAGPELFESAKIVRPRGVLVSTLFGPEQSAFVANIRVAYIRLGEQPPDLAKLFERIAAGKLKADISGRFALEDAVAALLTLRDKNSHGKIVVTVPSLRLDTNVEGKY